MKGKHKVVVKNRRLHYEFEIKRNITIIQGDSATGKTTLIEMLRQVSNLGESYQIYSDTKNMPVKPSKIITEDSNAGYEFFEEAGKKRGILCESAGGKTKIFDKIKECREETCVVADGAAIGPEMSNLYHLTMQRKNIKLFLPESFEWLILKSGKEGNLKRVCLLYFK